MRQGVYSTIRFGLYDVFCTAMQNTSKTKEVGLVGKIGSGLLAGGIGAIIACPLDVVLVRMAADGKVPPEQRRNYKHVIDGLIRIQREEGLKSLWIGSLPTVSRAMVITASQFAAYDSIKSTFVQRGWMKDGTPNHLLSGFLAGVIASITSTPFDTIRTRLMNDKPPPNNRFSGMVDCISKTIREPGGVFALYKGFIPTSARQLPYVVVMFITLEQMKKLFRWMDNLGGSSSPSPNNKIH
jgi:solute carrier family 25 oxoglutarate transporter 11